MKTNTRQRQRHAEWQFDMAKGIGTHIPSGLKFCFAPAFIDERKLHMEGCGITHPILWRTRLLVEDFDVKIKIVWLPHDTPDQRKAHEIDPQDANAYGVNLWLIYSQASQEQAFFNLAPDLSAQLTRIYQEAGERWLYRVRLERKRTDGAINRAH